RRRKASDLCSFFNNKFPANHRFFSALFCIVFSAIPHRTLPLYYFCCKTLIASGKINFPSTRCLAMKPTCPVVAKSSFKRLNERPCLSAIQYYLQSPKGIVLAFVSIVLAVSDVNTVRLNDVSGVPAVSDGRHKYLL